MTRLATAIAILALAGTAAITTGVQPTPKAPQQAQSPEQDDQAITVWLNSLPLPGFTSQFPAGLNEYQSGALGALKAEPEFKQFLDELPTAGRVYFSRYFAWQIRNIKGEMAANETLFVHTIMNDLARLKTLSEDRIIAIRLERERQYGPLLEVVRDRLVQELESYDLPQDTVDSVMGTFDRSASDTSNFLTNPACAYCDLPAPPEIAQRMRRYQEENLSRVAKEVSDAMRMPMSEKWRLTRLKFAAAQVEQIVATDFANRMAYRDQPEIEAPGSRGERTLQPGPYSIFFPVEWDRFSYWRATGAHGWSGGASSGGLDDPEPHRTIVLRYHPDEDDPDRERDESFYDQPAGF